MEGTNASLINEHSTYLIENITCSPFFLNIFMENDVLVTCDKEAIECEKGNSAQVLKLLNLLKTRVKGFEVLCAALEKTGQDGPLAKLKPGYKKPQNFMTDVQITELKDTRDSSSSKNLIVGTPECTVPRIVTVVEDNDVGHVLLNEWSKLARRLGIRSSKRDEFSDFIAYKGKKNLEIFEKVLEEWVSQNGTRATLSELLKHIVACNSCSVAESIKKEFGIN